MTLLSLSWNNLARRKMRTVLSIAGVSMGVAAAGIMFSLVVGFEKSLGGNLLSGQTDAVVMRITARSPFPAAFTRSRAEELGKLTGVEEAVPVLWGFLHPEGGKTIPVQGVPENSFLWKKFAPKPEPGASEETDSILLGSSAAELLGKTAGESLRVRSRKLTVAGIFETTDQAENAGSLLPLGVMQELTGKAGQVNLVHLRLQEGWDARTIATLSDSLSRRFRGLHIFQSGELAGNLPAMQIVRAVATVTSALMLGIAVLGVTNCLLMNISEQRREIAILRSLGWRKPRVAILLTTESLTICLIGAVVGSLLTLAFGWAISQRPEWFGSLRPALDPLFPLQAAGIATACGLLASLFPVFRACNMPPAARLEHWTSGGFR